MLPAVTAYRLSTHCMLVAVLAAGISNPIIAATVTNTDRMPRKVTVIDGAPAATHTLEMDAVIHDLCNNGCIIRIDNDPEREFSLEGNERVSIENGLIFYDGQSQSER